MEFGWCGLKGQKWEVVAFFPKKFPFKERRRRMSRCQTKEFPNEGRGGTLIERRLSQTLVSINQKPINQNKPINHEPTDKQVSDKGVSK